MILTAHQPVYLPWLGLFHKIALADAFVSFNRVQYQPKDWNNRNLIKTPQGPLWLTVPVLRKGYLEKTIAEIEINNNEPWQRKHWRSILGNYRRAPFFDQYSGFFEDVYRREWRFLAQLNDHMLKWFLDTLGIRVKFLDASHYQFQGAKSELVLDMCRQLGASTYIFGALGKGYADVAAFEGAGVDIHFQEYKHPEYPQQGVQFIPCLSIVDLLFNCGDRSGDILMSANISKAELLARGRRGVLRVSSDPEEGKREGSFCGTQGSFPVKRLSVLIRADASETIGTGHVMRMLALAQALKDKGELVTLVTVGTPDSLVMRWEAEGIRVVRLAVSHPDPRDAMLTLHLACQSHADWVIADGYHFDVEFHRQIRQAGLALLVVDDYAHLANYDADLVLNQNISAVDLAYHLPEYTRPLLGLSYVMLRRDFRRASESLAPARAVAQRVLITLGGGDEHNVTGLVVEALSGLTGNRLILDVVIGATYAHRTILEGQLAHSPHEIHLHVNTCDMPNLMRQADIAVSGAGSTCWELAAMGVPTCLVTLAENQRAMAERLGEIGAMVSLGWHYQLGAARVVEVVGELLRNIDLRARMRAICLPLVDGLGCERIIEQLKVSRARQP